MMWSILLWLTLSHRHTAQMVGVDEWWATMNNVLVAMCFIGIVVSEYRNGRKP